MSDGQFDFNELKRAKEYANHLKGIHGERDRMLNEMEKFLMLVWDEETTIKRKVKNVKLTKDPSPRNKLLGMVRLLSASDPKFSLPIDRNRDTDIENGDQIEQWCAKVWEEAGKISNVLLLR